MSSRFRTVALIGKYASPDTRDSLERLGRFLESRQINVVLVRHTAEITGLNDWPTALLTDLGGIADLAIVIGGDGTMLNIARGLGATGVPLVGVNRGRLGFLTDVSVDTMLDTVGEILDGEFIEESRILLNAEIRRGDRCLEDACAFNDVVVSKSFTGRLIEFEIYVDRQFVYSQRADGVVVATPTGSTAYALSAGGPILHPTLDAFALVPICPHTLSARPIAVNGASTVEIIVTFAEDPRVHFDGQRHLDLAVGDRVVVQRGPKPVHLLHPVGHSYYDTLRQKLHWGEKL